MKPIWFIQESTRLDANNMQRIVYTVQEQGMEVITAKYMPFDTMDWSILPIDRPVIMQGSINAIKNAQKRSKAYPLAWCNWEQLECRSYYANLGKFIVQSEYGFYPLGDIRRMCDYLYKTYSDEGNIFIKPNENNKEFVGALVEKPRFEAWWYLYASDAPINSLAIVSKPRNIIEEWRFIVVDGKVITGSQYMFKGRLCPEDNYPVEAATLAEEVFKTWTPHPVLIVDIGRLEDESYKLIEIGGLNCAGYYKSDIAEVIKAVSNVAEREWDEKTTKLGTNNS